MEIITRTSETEKQTISTKGYNEKMQVSYNNFGHIALRFFSVDHDNPKNANSICKDCGGPITYAYNVGKWEHVATLDNGVGKAYPPESRASHPAIPSQNVDLTPFRETLIVLDVAESRDLIQFIKERLQ